MIRRIEPQREPQAVPMKRSGRLVLPVVTFPVRRDSSACGGSRLSGHRKFASVLLLAAVSALLAACSSVSPDGTIPRNGVHAPLKAHHLVVINEMLFEFGENPLERKTVRMPEGEYIFEGEDDIFLYFRSPEPLEYRVHHKEGYAEGFFQMGGIALANKDCWHDVEYPVCTYTDGEDQRQKRLTCPLESMFMIQKRGYDWECDFDAPE